MVTGNERYIIDTLDSMPINDARKAIASGQFGSPGRPDRTFASELLATKEAEERDKREAETLSIAKEANRIASNALADARLANRSRWKDRIMTAIAIIIATIAAREDIMWFISWILSKMNTS